MAQAAGFSFNSDTVAGSKVRDLAGYFLHGTIVGSAAITTGKSGYGDALNCTGGALQVPVEDDTYPINTDGGLTVAAWVKLNTTTAAARCIASGISNGGSTRDWALYASNGSGFVEFKLEGATHSTSISIRDSAWHHVMVVVNKVSGPGNESVRIVIDGTQQYVASSLTTGFEYTGSVVVEVGRNGLSGGTEVLDGIVDDFRWWNDPVSSASWAAVMGTEQADLQLAVYPFDGNVTDYSTHGRDLTQAGSASYDYAMYGHGLVSTTAAAGASLAVNFGDLDRLAITGYIRLDTAPVGSAAPIMAITTAGGTNQFRAVVNTDRTVTLTWITIYGTFSVSSTGALTVGAWTRFHFNMNPTYVGIRLGSNTQQTTSTGNSDPHLTPTVNDLDVLYIGGDAAAGGAVSFDYVTCTQNFIDIPANNYWCGPPVVEAVKPTSSARGVYEFNENTGTTANDQSAFNNDLTLASGAGWTTGVEGSAVAEASTAGQAAGNTSLTWSSTPRGWAFSGWFKARASSAGARMVVLRNGSSEVAHVFYLSGGFQLRLYGSGGNTGLLSPAGSLFASETWTHLAASCNGTTIQFYKNGVRYGHADFTLGTLLSPTILRVGGDDADGSGEGVADVDSLTLFDTPLSDSQVAWLFQNPGDFAAAVPVEVTRATTWDVKAAVTATRATTWNTNAAVEVTRATTWRVLAAVSKALSTTWNTLAAVTRTRATTWDTLQQVETDRATTWDTKAAVTRTRSTTWDTLTAVEIERDTTWDVEASTAVEITRSTSWDVKAAVTVERPTSWSVKAAVQATRATTWNVLAAVSRTRATMWRVLKAITIARSTTWDVDGPAATIPPGLTVSNEPGSNLTASNTTTSDLEVSNGV